MGFEPTISTFWLLYVSSFTKHLSPEWSRYIPALSKALLNQYLQYRCLVLLHVLLWSYGTSRIGILKEADSKHVMTPIYLHRYVYSVIIW